MQSFIDFLKLHDSEPLRSSDIRPGAENQFIALAYKKKKALYYSLSNDGTHGWFYNCANGETASYRQEGAAHGPIDKKERERARREYEALKVKSHKEAAQRANDIWAKAFEADAKHAYLIKKQIKPHGIKQENENLLIPMVHKITGPIIGLQKINQEGDKLFGKGTEKHGAFFLFKKPKQALEMIIICEGYATGASLFEVTGYAVFAAFDKGNLIHVAKYLRQELPSAKIIIAGDNDKNGSGQKDAQRAASEVGAYIKISDIEGMDWNDYILTFGSDDVKKEFTEFGEIAPLIAMEPEQSGGGNSISPEVVDDSQSVPAVSSIERPPIDWMDLVKFKDRETGELHKDYTLRNAEALLTHKQPIGGALCYDDFLDKRMVIKALPWEDESKFVVRELNEMDIRRLRVWLEDSKIRINKNCVDDVVQLACQNKRLNPAIDYLNSLQWDNTPRLDTWLTYYLGAETQPKEYLSRIGACYLIAAVKRILNPGTAFHHMLVLEGGQAAMKSTTLATLATFGRDRPISYFSDRVTFEMIDKQDFATYANGNVILEFQELSGLGKKDRNKVKQWITQTHDEYRKPYDHIPTKYPRKFILAGTTNDTQYLNDPTGDRRFWPVRVGHIDIDALRHDREQIWAEATHRAKAGELWYVNTDDPIYKTIQNEQSARYSGDPWDNIVEIYIENRTHVTIDEIFTDVLYLEKSRWDTLSRARISNILTKAGFESKTVRDAVTKKTVRKWARINAPSPSAQRSFSETPQ
jgi:putative DNA primase/helicase